MLPQVIVGRHCCAQSTNPDNYRPLVGDELIDELGHLAQSLAGARICEINATSAGGGVAELLAAEMPVLQAIGVNADWQLIHGDAPFFEVTKAFHNALQGADLDLSETIKQTYLDRNLACAEMIEGAYDVYIVHDYLVADIEGCAQRVLNLLDDAEEKQALGEAGAKGCVRSFYCPDSCAMN